MRVQQAEEFHAKMVQEREELDEKLAIMEA
jgi:hypothetical protein